MQRVDVVLKDATRTFEPGPVEVDAEGNSVPALDSAGIPKKGRETTPSHKIKVLTFEDRLRIVRDGADENSTGVEVFVRDGFLDAKDFDGPIAEVDPPAPAADVPPEPPPAPVEV